MIAFEMLSPLVRAMFALWLLLLCLMNIGNAVLATVKKRYCYTAFAILLFAPAYLMWQVVFDFSLFGNTDKLTTLSEALCGISWTYWLADSLLLTLTTALLLRRNIIYDRTFITPSAIKRYLDKIPCGICCWRENGRVLFSNICMNELCEAITNHSLLNGNELRNAVQQDIMTIDGRVWRFACREFRMDGERLWEMIASDITKEYAKTAALEKDKAELSRLNKELREYYLSIDESVHRQEILQAKMNIHDEMNRLMLSTMAAGKTDAAELDGIFSLWEQNALLLCMEADEKKAYRQSDELNSLATALGISLIWNNPLPDDLDEKQKELFFFAAQEAVINAVKHASAKNMEISFEQNGGALECRFTNDGKMPEGKVRFEGGLANISRLAEKQDASVSAEVGEKFSLILKYHSFG